MLQYLFIYLKAQHLYKLALISPLGGLEQGDAAAWAFDVWEKRW